jgi:pimeloyl-ACP methyl ester carboxylesterase
MKHKEISYKGTSIYYKVTGEGLPVFLIHGFGEDGQIWDMQTEYLSGQFKLIIPDVPGSGKSTSLNGNKIEIDDYADCIKAIALEEQISDFVMIGHSMGGYISLAYLDKYPNDLAGIGLIHSTAYPDDVQKIETRKKAIQFIESNGSEVFLKTSVPGLFYNPELNKQHINLLIERSSVFSKEQLIQYYEAMIGRPDRTPILKRTSIPVLIIAGKHDIAISKEAILQQAGMPDLCHFYMLNNSGHMGMLEETTNSNQILGKFLQSFNEKQNHARN